MVGTLVLDTDQGERLVGAYRVSADGLDHDRRVVAGAVAGVAAELGHTHTVLAEGIGARLIALAGLLRNSAADLDWRVAYVRARAASGLSVVTPQRDPHLETMTVAELVDALTGDDGRAALHELAIRVSVRPTSAGHILRTLGPDRLAVLTDQAFADANGAMQEVGANFFDPPDGMTDDEYVAHARAGLDRAIADYGVLLAAMSHTHQGRTMLRTAWQFDDTPHVTALSIALLHGMWDEVFLLDLADDVFSDSWVRYGFDSTIVASWWGGGVIVPELHPPHGAVLAALNRNPEAASTFLFDRDGYVQLTGPDGWPGQSVFTDEVFDGFVADLLETVLGDPANHARVADALLHGRAGRPAPLLEAIATQPLPGVATADIWAEILSTQWPTISGATHQQRSGSDDVADAFAALFEVSDDALPILLAGFGPLLEARFAEAYAEGGDFATLGAMNTAERAVNALSQGLAGVDPGSDEHAHARSAFEALLGYGASSVKRGVGLAGLPGLVFSHIAGELIDEIGSTVLPDTTRELIDGRSVFDSLFASGDTLENSSQAIPPPGQVMLANAVLAAHPEDFVDMRVPWIRNGVIDQPTERDDLIEFGAWFYETFETPEYTFKVVEMADDIADEAHTWLDVDWDD